MRPAVTDMYVRDEIAHALATLALGPENFRKLEGELARALYYELLTHFVEGGDRQWWWEAFKEPAESKQFDDGLAFQRLSKVVPSPYEKVWFMVGDDQEPIFPIYEATPHDIQRVIGECYAFEYYLISKSKDWLICENHHDYLILVGDTITPNLTKMDA